MRRRHGRLILVASILVTLAACSGGSSTPQDSPAAAASERHGGQATVLLSSAFAGFWPAGLDPATNYTGGANVSLMNAIYGGLFQLTADEDGSNAKITGVLAESYEIAEEGRALVIRLRPGVTFSDGTPFDAETVKAGMERNLQSGCSCAPVTWPWAPKDRISVRDAHTVVLRFHRPYGPVINAFPASNLNWIASPRAYAEQGDAAFRITPVGAGPFRVVSNQLSSRLVLERNPNYWQKDRPYLDRLVFQSIGSEQAGFQALLAGDADAYEGIASPAIIREAEGNPKLTVTRQPPTSPGVVQLNTAAPPFNDPRAREAIYYATDVHAIRKGLFDEAYPATQSFLAPGGLFYRDGVPGYRTYDLKKAQSIVKSMGGLQVKLATLKAPLAEQINTALQTQWKNAGIDVTLEAQDLGTLINTFQSGQWHAMLQTAGSFDPDAGSGLAFRFGSGAPLSGVKDADLDRMIEAATGTVDPQVRDELYQKIAKYISDKAYAPFLVANAPAQVARGLHAPGLTTRIPAVLVNTSVFWQDAWLDRK